MKVRRLAVSDAEVEGILDSIDFGPSSRISFDDFVSQICVKAVESKTQAGAAMGRLQSLLLILVDEWAKLAAKMERASLNESPLISDEDVDKVVAFMDPNGDGIDSRELEEAFRLVKRSVAAEAMEPGAVSCMKILMGHLRKKNTKVRPAERAKRAQRKKACRPAVETGSLAKENRQRRTND